MGDAPFQPLHPLRYWGYQLWSGIGSDLQEVTLLIGLIAGVIAAIRLYKAVHHHFECHEETCSRLGVHHVAGTHFRTCWPHHPVLSDYGHKKVPLAHIHAAHDEANGGR